MPVMALPVSHGLRRIGAGACMGLALLLGGCITDRNSDVTGSIAPSSSAPASRDADMRAYAKTWGDKYRADPGDRTAALNYGRALRSLTEYGQAVAVLESAALKSPYDLELVGAYGKALADAGRFKDAAGVLSRAQTADNPNWSILSAQGSVADQMGDHAQAQGFYANALKIKPNDPSVLSNLGLSYALSNRLVDADRTMRQAVAAPGADMRVRQNFALVLALEGQFGEAEQVAQQDQSPADASASVAAIKAMIAQSDTWRAIQRGGGKAHAAPPKVATAAKPAPQLSAQAD